MLCARMVAMMSSGASRRRRVTQPVKKFIASSQKWRCARCSHLLDHTYEVDHIRPLFLNGSNEMQNLQALCPHCHAMKTFEEAHLRRP